MHLPPHIAGTLDYWLRPRLRSARELYDSSWMGYGPMNGQAGRQSVVKQLFATAPPTLIVETGTYRGVTTEFLANIASSVPVHTIESNPRLYAYSQWRLRALSNVTCHLGDSGGPQLANLTPDVGDDDSSPFVYLDAHWDYEAPLLPELEIVRGWRNAIVMIDDFEVPGTSYTYLDRGPRCRVNNEFIAQDWPNAHRWYPVIPPYAETGQRTGYVLLATSNASAALLNRIPLLRHELQTYGR